MAYYPIAINLKNERCLVVGGGRTALRKAKTLSEAGAKVHVISREIDAELENTDGVTVERRSYQSGDARGCALIFAATDDKQLNMEISEDASHNGVLVNVVDDPELCTFIVPATCRRGDLMISVTTSGKSPMLAKKIRQELETSYGEHYGEYVELLGEMREIVKRRYDSASEREAAFGRLINSGILELLRNGRKERAREMAIHCI